MQKYIGVLGIFTILGIAYLLSNNKKNINYKLVAWGISIQLIFAILILKSPIGKPVFSYLDKVITKLISFSDAGSDFLFKSFINLIVLFESQEQTSKINLSKLLAT